MKEIRASVTGCSTSSSNRRALKIETPLAGRCRFYKTTLFLIRMSRLLLESHLSEVVNLNSLIFVKIFEISHTYLVVLLYLILPEQGGVGLGFRVWAR